ncbi:unnamed protein product [Cylindrotheca closterium]|uniref:Eukaryotic translation initiation factor 4E n=1 Tax=Cylindrotheca closterium TaxID=2856 RepID=A0AAD2CQP1_9STRA|nr:unnamed protein product [Cylindrotheca closterium]
MAATMEEKKVEEPTTNASESAVEWVLWQHYLPRYVKNDQQWKDDTSEVAHFFAHHPTKTNLTADLSHLPLPSAHFFLKNERGHHELAPQMHMEYSLFKEGTEPSWSDEHCKGELYTKHYFPSNLLDQYWHNLVEGVMNGTIEDQHIVAIRVVDKSHGKHPLYKLEVWLDTAHQQTRDRIRMQAMKCVEPIVDDHHRFKFHWRDFSNGPKAKAMNSKQETTLSHADDPLDSDPLDGWTKVV